MGGFMTLLGKVRKIIGKLTDILIQGRQAGLWTEKDGAKPGAAPHDPTFPNGHGR